MAYSALTFFHIVAGSAALLSGATALSVRKGSRSHRMAGNVFAGAMLGMAVSGAYIAFLAPRMLTVVVGTLTAYLVISGWMVVKRKPGDQGAIEVAAMLVGLMAAIGGIGYGLEAVQSTNGLKNGFPPPPYFTFGSIAALAVVLDISVFLRRGIAGAQRIARHLWRMCFALLLACLSVFIGQEQVFPEAVRKTHLLPAPVLIVAGLLIFWLIRVLFSKAWRDRPAPPAYAASDISAP